MTDDILELSCHDLGEMAEIVDRLYGEFMDAFEQAGITPIAGQHYLLAMLAIRNAATNFRLAHYEQMAGR